VARRVHDRRHIDTAAFADKPPDEARHERQHRLSLTYQCQASMTSILHKRTNAKAYITFVIKPEVTVSLGEHGSNVAWSVRGLELQNLAFFILSLSSVSCLSYTEEIWRKVCKVSRIIIFTYLLCRSSI